MTHLYDGQPLAVRSRNKIYFPLSALAAGPEAEFCEEYELLDLNDLITNGREGYVAYKITGDSMSEEIKQGFIVFADAYCEPKHGDIIVSRVNGKNCVKIFEKNTNGLYLISANKDYQPKHITKKDEFQILGVVKAHLAVYGKR